jgi:hypothetical protein
MKKQFLSVVLSTIMMAGCIVFPAEAVSADTDSSASVEGANIVASEPAAVDASVDTASADDAANAALVDGTPINDVDQTTDAASMGGDLALCATNTLNSHVKLECSEASTVQVGIVATAGNDYTQWRQSDPAWNQSEAWPASEYPNATTRYMSGGGCLVTSIAMLLRQYNIVTTSDVNSFNPWICNENENCKCKLDTPVLEGSRGHQVA